MKLFDREKFELAWNWMISDLIAIARRQPNLVAELETMDIAGV